MNSGTVVIGYTRVSLAEQATNGHGLDAQEVAIKAECERRGWVLREIVRDEGASGRDLDRPGLTRALEAIAAGEAAGLVAAKLDRLSRSVIDFGMLLEWFSRAGASVVALDVGVDTSTPAGRMVANVMVSVAEWEREVIAQRTSEGMTVAAMQGKRPAPAVADDPVLAARIRDMREGGMSLQAIADTLTAEGVPTARGAAKWSKSAVQVATGYKRPKPARKPATLPAINARRRSSGRSRPTAHQ